MQQGPQCRFEYIQLGTGNLRPAVNQSLTRKSLNGVWTIIYDAVEIDSDMRDACYTLTHLTLVYRRGEGVVRFIFRHAKTLNSTLKWLQLIVESSFLVILMQKKLIPFPGVWTG